MRNNRHSCHREKEDGRMWQNLGLLHPQKSHRCRLLRDSLNRSIMGFRPFQHQALLRGGPVEAPCKPQGALPSPRAPVPASRHPQITPRTKHLPLRFSFTRLDKALPQPHHPIFRARLLGRLCNKEVEDYNFKVKLVHLKVRTALLPLLKQAAPPSTPAVQVAQGRRLHQTPFKF